MSFFGELIDKFTGKAERNALINKIEEVKSEYNFILNNGIENLNSNIAILNNQIDVLNDFRINHVKNDINTLKNFLDKFGILDESNNYLGESKFTEVTFPQQIIYSIDDYIDEYDLRETSDWWKLVLGGAVTGVVLRYFRNKENKKIYSELENLKVKLEGIKNTIRNQEYLLNQNIEIAKIYIVTIKEISETISNLILPEFELVEAFCQAKELKNYVLVDKNIKNVVFKNSIIAYKGTRYERHYNFIKNTFLFYIMSNRIYNTPILSRLFNNFRDSDASDDIIELKDETNKLMEQKRLIQSNLMIITNSYIDSVQ